MAESDERQQAHDQQVRELLNAGRGVRLRVLFRMTEYPKDTAVLSAQGHSVVRFLTQLPPPADEMVLKDAPVVGRSFPIGRDANRRLIAFVHLGAKGNTAESWARAASNLYGFESVDEMEAAWLASLKKPPVARKATEAPRADAERWRIPPAGLPTLPGPKAPEPPPQPGVRP
jgi:hypothetical protein